MKRYKSHSSVNYDEDNVYRLPCKGKDINDPDRNGELPKQQTALILSKQCCIAAPIYINAIQTDGMPLELFSKTAIQKF